jgi:hypothetical protein
LKRSLLERGIIVIEFRLGLRAYLSNFFSQNPS